MSRDRTSYSWHCIAGSRFDCSRESSGRASQDCAAQLDLANIERLAINVGLAEAGGAGGHLLGAALANYLDSADYSAQTAAMEALLVVNRV